MCINLVNLMDYVEFLTIYITYKCSYNFFITSSPLLSIPMLCINVKRFQLRNHKLKSGIIFRVTRLTSLSKSHIKLQLTDMNRLLFNVRYDRELIFHGSSLKNQSPPGCSRSLGTQGKHILNRNLRFH